MNYIVEANYGAGRVEFYHVKAKGFQDAENKARKVLEPGFSALEVILDVPGVNCPACGEFNDYSGLLGRTAHYSCRACGMEYHETL